MCGFFKFAQQTAINENNICQNNLFAHFIFSTILVEIS